jgi:energy-coupling factor transport system substrate-specific component
MIGLFKYWSKDCVHEGNLPGMQILLFIVISFVANFLGYLVSALLDALLYTEPLDKVFTQQILAATTNTLMIATLGTLLLYLVARRNASSRDLKKDEKA